MSLPETGSQSENPPMLQNGRIYNGSKRAHIVSIFSSKSSSQGTPTERSLAAPAHGEACVSKKSPMVRDIGVVQKMHFYFVLVLLLAPPAGGKMIGNAFSSAETLRVSTPSSHGRTIRLVGLKLHSRGVLRAAPDVNPPKTKLLRAQVTMSLPEAGYQSENPPILQNGRIYNGSKRAHI